MERREIRIVNKRMEPQSTPLVGVRKKADHYRAFFFDALRQEEGIVHDEQISLESAFHRFVTAPDVIAYYSLVPLIGDVLERVKLQCGTHPNLCKLFDSLQKTAASKDVPAKRLAKEVTTLLEEIVHILLSVVDEEFLKRDSPCDATLFHNVLRAYWTACREEYLTTLSEKATRPYVMQELLGFNMSDKGDAYETRWHGAVWEYLSERDHYHLQIIARMEKTQRELDGHYLTMKNVVSFKSLVMLTMWRVSREKGVRSIAGILGYGSEGEEDEEGDDEEVSTSSEEGSRRCGGGGGGEEDDWTLAYGSFVRDYATFTRWHTHHFEGRQVHLNLYYIDFDASRTSDAIHLDMASVQRDAHHSPASFAALFVHHKHPLGLSYMRSKSDLVSSSSRLTEVGEDVEEGDEAPIRLPPTAAPQQQAKGRRGGIASLFTGAL